MNRTALLLKEIKCMPTKKRTIYIVLFFVIGMLHFIKNPYTLLLNPFPSSYAEWPRSS